MYTHMDYTLKNMYTVSQTQYPMDNTWIGYVVLSQMNVQSYVNVWNTPMINDEYIWTYICNWVHIYTSDKLIDRNVDINPKFVYVLRVGSQKLYVYVYIYNVL
jgi:hypothetical protein